MIGVVAITAGFKAKNVISYSTVCIKEKGAQDFVSSKETTKNFSIFWISLPQKDQKGIKLK